MMTKSTKVIIVCLVAGLCVGCDQFTKSIAKEGLDRFVALSYLNDTVRLQYAENHGGMLSLGSNLDPEARFLLLTVVVAVALGGFLVFIMWNSRLSLVHVVGLSLVVGGGGGNLIDRIFNNGAVIDFLVVEVGMIRTAVFNMADVAILTGVVILIFSANKKQENPAEM